MADAPPDNGVDRLRIAPPSPLIVERTRADPGCELLARLSLIPPEPAKLA